MPVTLQPKTVRIGVDVGGTNTDAVIIDPGQQYTASRGILAHHKTPTTPLVTEGIQAAVQTVLTKSRVPHQAIASVTVGTTHFINAVIEHDSRRLRAVAVLRLSKSFLREVPPYSEFPVGLERIINGYVGYCDGGLHIDGTQEAPIVDEQVVQRCAEIRALGLTAVVIVGVFSPIDDVYQQECRVAAIVHRELPGIDVVMSHQVANIGLMERENASVLNAAILPYARRTVRGFKKAMKALGLNCPLFLTQNDGTLLDADAAAAIPIRTFCSGATNSMRGAAYLSGGDTNGTAVIVADIGGTTTDVGVLLPSGLPRQASAYVLVAGVRVNYSMPLLHSIGLGGGSIVREGEAGQVSVGPDSVGLDVVREALSFGGEVMTATDAAVAAGKARIGTRIPYIPGTLLSRIEEFTKSVLERTIDVVKTSPEPMPVLLVGGGAVLAPSSLDGASQLILPPFHDVANAVGAAISKVAGAADMIQNVSTQSPEEAIERAKQTAIQRAIDAGALPDSVVVAEVDTYPVSYVANQLRTVVKAIGDLDVDKRQSSVEGPAADAVDTDTEDDAEPAKAVSKTLDELPIDHGGYRPTIVTNPETGVKEWLISEIDLLYLTDGCYILGCAGGGSPASTRIQLRNMLRDGYKMRVVDASSLHAEDTIYCGGFMGSPATSVERLQSIECVLAMQNLMEYLGHTAKDVAAVLALEIGGANGLEPLLAGSSRFLDRPVVDADLMGRAYPTYWQTTLAVNCPNELVPCVIDSGDGKTIIMTKASNDEIVDRGLRAACAEMGSRVGLAARPISAPKVQKFAVLNTISLAWRIGRCIYRAEANQTLSTIADQIIEEVGGPRTAKILFRGKIVSVDRGLHKGHSVGSITIAAVQQDLQEGTKRLSSAVKDRGTLKIPFKNENIYAQHQGENGETSCILASVPDLICVLDADSGRNLGVPEYRYGLRVTVLGITCSPRWTESEAGLRIGGPMAFGYDDVVYKPVGEYIAPKSVIQEYFP